MSLMFTRPNDRYGQRGLPTGTLKQLQALRVPHGQELQARHIPSKVFIPDHPELEVIESNHVSQASQRSSRACKATISIWACEDLFMELEEMQKSARRVRARFESFEQDRYGRSWTPAEIMLGFAGDVGDLSKLVQAKSGVRSMADSPADLDTKVGHELADCLWSVLTLADCYNVDLGRAFATTMIELNRWLDDQDARRR